MDELQSYLEHIVNSIADPIFVKDREHRWVLLNDAFCQFMGYPRERVLGKSDYEFFPKNQADVFWTKDEEVFREGQENTNEEQFTDASGALHTIVTKKTRYADEKGNLYIVGIIRDVTETKKLEKQLLEAQKMEAVGLLAGGIAHEFNNIMMIIQGYSRMVLSRFTPSDTVYPQIEEIDKASGRAVKLVKQLLSFSRRQMIQPKIQDLNQLIDRTQAMIRPLIKENIHLSITKTESLGKVKVDEGEIQQVIVNMVLNAQDAMPAGGNLSIKTERRTLDKRNAAVLPDLKPGTYAVLSLEDTGMGMTPEIRAHLFEPFFTTKPPDKGTGLGLATSYGIIKRSLGHIEVLSIPGKGSCFEIYLAVFTDGSECADEIQEKIRCAPRGTQTILIAEDESGIRALASLILTDLGYTVLTAANGTDALEVVQKHGAQINLLLSDIIMPRMGGFELYRQMQQQFPHIKTLFMTGYAEEALGEKPPGITLLQKPFSRETLASKIHDVLNG